MKLLLSNTSRALATAILIGFAASINATEEIVPRIEIADAPLLEAIRALGRQTHGNYIIDPHVPAAFDLSRTQPTVSQVWTNVTVQTAFNSLLTEHHLKTVINAATTVTRIVPIKLDVKPVPASNVGTSPSKVMPLIVIDDAPISEAIAAVTKSIGLKVSFDPEVPAHLGQGLVSIRWEQITERQALAALLDNFGLVMREDPTKETVQISLKPKE
jgi:type II secretory pathway component GspD/PulD (secretin)